MSTTQTAKQIADLFGVEIDQHDLKKLIGMLDEFKKSVGKKELKEKKDKKNDSEKPKRIPSSYQNFSTYVRKVLKDKKMKIEVKEIMGKIGEQWKQLEQKEKDKYKDPEYEGIIELLKTSVLPNPALNFLNNRLPETKLSDPPSEDEVPEPPSEDEVPEPKPPKKTKKVVKK